jgi:Zn-dependent peptidase ImmA (M78 family)/DNA-binding XRE family transcriptional regulator
MPVFNGKRLAEIRTIRGMTMERLASELGKTKQMVLKYEDGKSTPQIEAIRKMAMVLSVPIKYLFKESIILDRTSSALFLRAPLATPKKTIAYARIVSGWGYEISQAVDNHSQPFIEFLIDDHLTIPEKAMELRRQWGLGSRPIKNMVELLELHGFNIFIIDSPELKTEAYSQIINGIPIIVINKQIGTAVRQRFSLAHELGHMVLHRNMIDDWELSSRSKEIENEAQQFAEYFLLPTGGFEDTFVSSKMDHLVTLKREWLVSLGALVIHCKNVGLIDVARRDYLQKQINVRGWKKLEPLDNKLECEKPCAIGNRISSKITDQNTYAKLFDRLRLPLDSVENLCSLPNGSLKKYADDSLGIYDVLESNQIEFEQLALFNAGGNHYA